MENFHVHQAFDEQQSYQPHPFPTGSYVNRAVVSQELLVAKRMKQLTVEEIATTIGGSKEWVAAALLGQKSMKREDAFRLAELLEVDSRFTYVL
ncbi:hypothetical protein [Evansella halocellulosilytica]|uniref:hypothetical protein n=1 Tax=Evansella halocellulosilytica TaxID=2011013 RepID=UPI000BB76E70|nr:hypothetical protein [Evansella halocellulosilytica]